MHPAPPIMKVRLPQKAMLFKLCDTAPRGSLPSWFSLFHSSSGITKLSSRLRVDALSVMIPNPIIKAAMISNASNVVSIFKFLLSLLCCFGGLKGLMEDSSSGEVEECQD